MSPSRTASSSRGGLPVRRIIVGALVLVILAALVAVGLWLRYRLFPGFTLATRVVEGSGTPSTAAVVGFTGKTFVVAWGSPDGVRLRQLGGDDLTVHTLTRLRYADAIVTIPDGALVTISDQFVRLNADGVPTYDIVTLKDSPPGAYRSYVSSGETLALATSRSGVSAGTVHFRAYNLTGEPIGELATLDATTNLPLEVGLTRLAGGDYLIAWTRSTPDPAVLVATVSEKGAVTGQTQVVYSAAAGAKLSGCSAAPTAGGGALIAWRENDGIYTLEVGASGAPGTPQRIASGVGQGEAPRVVFDGSREHIAWLSGPAGGTPQAGGAPGITWLTPGDSGGVQLDTAAGNLQSFDIAAGNGSWALVGVARGNNTWGVYGRIVPAP